MQLSFDTDKALRMQETRNAVTSIHKQAAELKTDGPHKEPPTVPELNRSPRKHDVVAWRNDGARLDTTRHETKEAAIEYALALPWVIYCRYAVMDGRNVVQIAPITIPDGMALDDNGMPYKLA